MVAASTVPLPVTARGYGIPVNNNWRTVIIDTCDLSIEASAQAALNRIQAQALFDEAQAELDASIESSIATVGIEKTVRDLIRFVRNMDLLDLGNHELEVREANATRADMIERITKLVNMGKNIN